MAEKAKRAVKLPESGQWPDRVAPIALGVGGLLLVIGFLMAFLYASPVNGAAVSEPVLVGDQMVTNVQLLSQKIFYFHMPVALVSFVALAFAGYYGVRFLMTKEQRFDTCTSICMEIALLFVVCTMITGEMWTRFEWGLWWTWDPRLTTYLILMIIVIAYFIPIIALVDVPICYMVTRVIPSSIHPVVLREGGMTGDMGMTVGVVMLGMTLLGFALYRMRFCQVRLTQRVEAIKEQLED